MEVPYKYYKKFYSKIDELIGELEEETGKKYKYRFKIEEALPDIKVKMSDDYFKKLDGIYYDSGDFFDELRKLISKLKTWNGEDIDEDAQFRVKEDYENPKYTNIYIHTYNPQYGVQDEYIGQFLRIKDNDITNYE